MFQIKQGRELDVSNHKRGNCGRKPKNINLEQFLTIPLKQEIYN